MFSAMSAQAERSAMPRANYQPGLYVKIKRCREEEARRIFDAAHVPFNPRMTKFLGSGGAVRERTDSTNPSSCISISTPDGTEYWWWPYEMLEALQCQNDHHMLLVQCFGSGQCVGCASRISSGQMVHRCQECDFNLCNQCAAKQATWSTGQYVKIRRARLRHVRRIQNSGPAGWAEPMKEHLGEVQKIVDFAAGRCQLDGAWWWMLGLLEESHEDETHQEPQNTQVAGYQDGAFVKIKHCSVEEARRIFANAGVPFNSLMEPLLGTGGEVQTALENECTVFTPDRHDFWTWPHEMLEMLRCREGHDLKTSAVAVRSSRCNGCRSNIDLGETASQCQLCGFDLCKECAHKQATWSAGRRVKIRSVSANLAESMQDDGPGWIGDMRRDLGETKEILQLGAGRCQVAGGRWWLLGLLEVPEDSEGICVGAFVRVRPGVSPRYGWGGVAGERGQVIEIEVDSLRVRFPSHSRWRGLPSELELCEGEVVAETTNGIRIGSLVRVREGVSPHYDWGAVSPGERGWVVDLEDGGDVVIDFPSQDNWHGLLSELELCDAMFDDPWAPWVSGSIASTDSPGNGSPVASEFGGYDEDWVDPVAAAAYKCPICLQVPRDAVMHSCRQIFCEKCWAFSHAAEEVCPVCRDSAKPAQQAYQQQWDIGKLQINCPLKCGETFPLSEKEQLLPLHLKECPHREVICPDCLVQVPAHGLREHLEEECAARPKCELCGVKVAASALEEHMQSPSKEHMTALIGEVLSLKKEVKDLREEVKVLRCHHGGS